MLKVAADRRHRHRQERGAGGVRRLRRAGHRRRRPRARRPAAPGRRRAAAIRARFGEAVIDRPRVMSTAPASAAIVFQDGEARRDLEAILHPAVYRGHRGVDARPGARAARWSPWRRSRCCSKPGSEGDFDRVVVTACDGEEQVRRAVGRSGVSDADARRRIAAQWPLAEKVRRADYRHSAPTARWRRPRRQARPVWDALQAAGSCGILEDRAVTPGAEPGDSAADSYDASRSIGRPRAGGPDADRVRGLRDSDAGRQTLPS